MLRSLCMVITSAPVDAEDVEQLTLEVAKLGFLDSSQTEDILNEFYQQCLTNKASAIFIASPQPAPDHLRRDLGVVAGKLPDILPELH